MTPGPVISPLLLRVVRIALPGDRRDEILADLEDGYRERASRLGEGPAKRHLYREVASLLLWRLRWWRGAAATRSEAGKTRAKSSMVGRDFFQDLRFGARTLRRRPIFTLTAVMVLGLGIGAPSTVLTVVNAIFFQEPSHVSNPDRIVRLSRSFQGGQGGGALGNPDYLYYRDNASTLSGLAAYGGERVLTYTADGDRHDQLRILFVSDNYFHLLGVALARGRGFLPEENATPGTHPVVVVSHAFWTRALGSEPDVEGRVLTLAGAPYTIVGVAPEGFGAPSPAGPAPDAWVPIAMYGLLTRASTMDWWQRVPHQRSRWLQALGRLAPGVTFEAARANLVALGEALDYDGKPEDEGAFVQRRFLYSPRVETTLDTLSRMLLVVVGVVLLVAASNVAVLLLSRATTRYREMGIRTALGAGRGRIIRQILVETLLLGGAGGLLGLAMACGLSDAAASLLPVRFVTEFRPDGRVIMVAGALTLLTALAVGLLPALHATRQNLREGIQGRSTEAPRSRIRNILVVGQVGLSLMLVAAALLFGRSFWTARTQELGFATENRLVVQVNLRENDYDAERGRLFVRQALERIRALPGVREAAATRMIPFQGDWTSEMDAPPDVQPNYGGNQILTGMNAVSSDYFQVAGITILQGRPLGPMDVEGSSPVIVINETLAKDLWPGQDPLGRTLPVRDGMDLEVVGVARTSTYYQLGEEPFPQTYLALDQFYQPQVHFLVHTTGPAAEMAPVVENTLREMDPRLAFGWITTMASVFEDVTSRYEVSAILVAIFGGIALLLAAAGLYGTLSYLVSRQTREIGVRMALGADRVTVAGEVMRFGLGLVSVGIGLGLVGAVALRRFTGSLLYGIGPNDPLPLVGSCLILLAVAAVATFAPVRVATRVDPVVAMRTE
jgi:putative ABC transport system permease protein